MIILFYRHLDLWAQLPVVSDLELRQLFRECRAFLASNEDPDDYTYIKKEATAASISAARRAVRSELRARGIGGSPWWVRKTTAEAPSAATGSLRLDMTLPLQTGKAEEHRPQPEA